MPQSILMRWFCRVYLVMLYAYPREFRLQFGGEMQQLFRDRCRQMTRTPGRWHWLRFAIQSAADWMSTMFHERMAAVREITVQDCASKTFPGSPHRLVRGTAHAAPRLRLRVGHDADRLPLRHHHAGAGLRGAHRIHGEHGA